ncbi:palmitoleoyl-protein carboxylesterase NOTUM-like [Actinia tenebrosa]|uniref:Palmitoleoyl-protein carboxylesterase NOTUM-like n=1 Tax=Actinia tenebrosa TaxID=6105 RepID=A0A6P8J502_ACTTE|nr:palmitoleoyl-protein carboxylesterase NOTUM-like [Actinia tenebrosa]XP_031574739.1 palmitoleoyl-protein carboxylesterase NOTUM-like [Actinia tenebrosa]XP_031574740.1 palmitoleoyl-protein carboxylesterase NOTUM-like [Actinia tenebrosa]XP_031574741.1 palmitoleoyl-protein carboxylesterase NOTUM-like [Actinia tenebrosa]
MHLERVVLCLLSVFVYSSEGFFDVSKSKTNLQTSKRLSTFDNLKDNSPHVSSRSQRSVRKRKKSSYNLRKVTIPNAEKRQALCLDGSVAVFYLSHNPLSKNWIIQLQAGGSCGSVEACRERAKGRYGSSKDYDLYMTGTFLSSDDPNENPTFASWNKVYVPYCSGDVFVGRRPKSTHPYGLQMLGHYIIKAVMEQLMADHHINSTENTILFGGASAGGLGMLANLDYVQNMLSPAKVRGFNDGGWFTLFPNFGEELAQGTPYFFSTLEVMFNRLWDGYVDESCRSEMPKPAACLYGELVVKYLSTPIYVMVAQWDSYQLQELVPSKFPTVRLPPELPSEAEYLSKFGNNTHRSLRRVSFVENNFWVSCGMRKLGKIRVSGIT